MSQRRQGFPYLLIHIQFHPLKISKSGNLLQEKKYSSNYSNYKL